MSILDFTIEEINLISMYKSMTAKITINRIKQMLPYMPADMKEIATSAIRKLKNMAELDYSKLKFTPSYDTEE